MNTDDPFDPARSSDMDDSLHELEQLVDEMRATVPVRPEWRRNLSAALRAERSAQSGFEVSKRRVQMRPMVALAAALAFTTAGALGTMLLSGESAATTWTGAAEPSGAAKALQQTEATLAGRNSSQLGVRFALLAPGAKRVSVVGDFNGWDATATPLQLASDGVTWTAVLAMNIGRHSYAFVIDGEVTADPAAPAAPDDDFGIPNSLMLVSHVP